MNRRRFLQTLGAAAGLAPWLARRSLRAGQPPTSGEGRYSGDEASFIHRYLRDGDSVETPQPEPGRIFDAIVVGGGVAGVAATYKLRDMDVLLIEKDRTIGGVSKKEVWEGIEYPIGAAYIGGTDPGSALDKFYRELGLHKEWRKTSEQEEALFTGGELIRDFWKNHPDFTPAREYFKQLLENRYPDIPFTGQSGWSRDQYSAMDRANFSDWLARGIGKTGRPYPPLLLSVIDCYCRAAFCAGLKELSAWAGLNFFLADMGSSFVLPGGNARVVERMAERIEGAKPGRIVAGRAVVRVAAKNKRWLVTTASADGKFSTYEARAVVVALPKFVAARVVDCIPSAQLGAISQIRTRPYLVVNGLFRRRLLPDIYGGYTLPGNPFTDLGVAEFASRSPSGKSVLALYYPMTEAQRGKLLLDDSFAGFQAQARTAFQSILAGQRMKPEDLLDVKLTRWGHAVPYPRPGQISSGLFEAASKPARGLWYCGQDSDGTPCIETALQSAFEAAASVRKHLS